MSLLDKLRGLLGRSSQNDESAPRRESSEGPAPQQGGNDVEKISCHDALRLVHEYLDGELEGIAEAEVKAHFDVCRQCYPHLHLESLSQDAVRQAVSRQSAPPELKARIEELLAEGEAGG